MNLQKMTKQQLKEYGESIGIKLNLKHKKDDLIDQLNKASQTNADNTIKADVKVEVTNATTEKAFKVVGDTISSGKQAVTTGAKATTSFAKKIMVPVIILAIIGGIGSYTYDQKQIKECVEEYNKKILNASPSKKEHLRTSYHLFGMCKSILTGRPATGVRLR
jgi:hypothetical protein